IRPEPSWPADAPITIEIPVEQRIARRADDPERQVDRIAKRHKSRIAATFSADHPALPLVIVKNAWLTGERVDLDRVNLRDCERRGCPPCRRDGKSVYKRVRPSYVGRPRRRAGSFLRLDWIGGPVADRRVPRPVRVGARLLIAWTPAGDDRSVRR